MKRAHGVFLVAFTVGAIAIAGTLAAHADSRWTVTAKPVRLKVRSDDMPRGVTPNVARDGTKAIVGWSTQEIAPGAKMQRYRVTAHSADSPPRPDVTHTVPAATADTQSTTFATTEVAGGKWYWTLVPIFESWTGAESRKSDKVAFPAAVTAPLPSHAVEPTPPAFPAHPVGSPSPRPPDFPTASPDISDTTPADSPPNPVDTPTPSPPGSLPPGNDPADD